MIRTAWFERSFTFGLPKGMFPFYLERLDGTLIRLEKKVAGLSEDILSIQLDGKWSVKQNIGHLAEVSEITAKRIDEIRSGITPMSPAMVQPGMDYNAQSVTKVLLHFHENRTKNLIKYKLISEQDLDRSSLHPRLKVQMTPVDLALFDAEHDDHHLVRINEIIGTLTTK
jgi:hypothetical protein